MKAGTLIILGLVLAIAGVAGFFYFKKEKPQEPPKDDSQLFLSKMEHFRILEGMALESMQRIDTIPAEQYLDQLKKTALVDWAECVNLMDETKKFTLDKETTTLRNALHQYANQRIQQTLLYIKSAEDGTRKFDNSIDSIEYEINELVRKTKRMHTGRSPAPKGL